MKSFNGRPIRSSTLSKSFHLFKLPKQESSPETSRKADLNNNEDDDETTNDNTTEKGTAGIYNINHIDRLMHHILKWIN
jgi:hypothetical protein